MDKNSFCLPEYPPGDAKIGPLVLSLEEISSKLVQVCDCKEFARLNSISFDSQDLFEQGRTACPCCQKPFAAREATAV